MSHNGVGACILGYADPDVDAAVRAAIDCGSMATLNCPEEVELADLLCELHPWAEHGALRPLRRRGDGSGGAHRARPARAAKRSRSAAITAGTTGIWRRIWEAKPRWTAICCPGCRRRVCPAAWRARAPLPLQPCGRAGKHLFRAHGPDLAAIVMEPVRNREPEPGFLESVRELASRAGAVLVFDEVTAAWRMNTGGAHLRYGVTPDIAVFAKAISNGYPMAAIIGTPDVMQAAQATFISSTYWTERIGPAAALATIRKHKRCDVSRRLIESGSRIQTGWRGEAERAGLAITVSGLPPLSQLQLRCARPPGPPHSLYPKHARARISRRPTPITPRGPIPAARLTIT